MSRTNKEKHPVIGHPKSKDIITVPNLLSIVRIILIPFMIYIYLYQKDYFLAACVLAVSYASDIADGIIARKFDMISDIGKILDPLADKLTQASMLICISIGHKYGWALFALLFVKEMMVALAGYFAVRRTGVVSGAKWYGKVCTVALNTMFAVLLFIPLPSEAVELTVMIACGAFMIVSMVAYVIFFTKNYTKSK